MHFETPYLEKFAKLIDVYRFKGIYTAESMFAIYDQIQHSDVNHSYTL